MSKIVTMVACLLLTALSAQAWAQGGEQASIDEVTKMVADKEAAQRAGQVALAPIRSDAELADYLKSHRASPLDAFSRAARAKFLDSLVFTDRGLGSYRTADIEAELTPRQANAILSLFGVQDSMAQLDFVHGSEAERQAAKSIGPIINEDHREYRCMIPATCIFAMSMICIGQNCGGGVP
jgi:hypothetical protein